MLTDREKAVITAYTGYNMLVGDKFSDVFLKYVEEKFERPVFIHELGGEILTKDLKELSKEDFKKLCNDEEI